ncbi:MAG: DUF5808 domain-containing protein [Flavobacterium sp.]|uniref:DUF5808 domain-containing protein n=1 Tax=Flavobacterium sp. TaxID=239 RepID=UPI0022C89010|nr:DUF5808 domain-containing protein [Flavobacterium sp.]MCZ8197271.1 DUF5808 domain-containing protein [Flavobacterium sp.]
MQEPTQETIEKWHKDSNNWKFGGIYYNKDDDRVFVPKAIKWMGITLNFANPKSYLALLAMIAFFGFIIYMIENK